MRAEIRKIIIERVCPEKRLSRSDPRLARIFFKVDWDPLRFYVEQGYSASLEDILEQAVTITGHGNDVQVATCVDYMIQTWPESGAALLKFLQASARVLSRGGDGLSSEEKFLSEDRTDGE